MTASDKDASDILNTVEGEISFFRAIMRSRPVGIHRHFHLISIQSSIFKDTGRLVPMNDLWNKLRSCYDMDALEAIDLEAQGYDLPNIKKSKRVSMRSPSPSQNLFAHPFFREEFSLPFEEAFETLISERRLRASPSIPSSSPAASPVADSNSREGKTRPKTRLKLAGLVGGDSDSSALTQESADEGMAGTPRDSIITATDGGTDNVDDEETENRELLQATSPRPARGRPKRGSGRGRAGTGFRATKRKKRGG